MGEWEARCEEAKKSVTDSFLKAGSPLKWAWSNEQQTEPVLTKTAAMRVAEAVWVPIYGEESMPANAVGGVAYIEIRRSDGEILKVSHGK